MTPAEKRRIVRLHIEAALHQRTPRFLKAKEIARENNLSTKEVAQALSLLPRFNPPFTITKDAYCRSNTYRFDREGLCVPA